LLNNNSIAVIIAAYNSENTIGRAIESVINEGNVKQIIIVDDCSSDNTFEIAKCYKNQNDKVSVYSTSTNSGPSKARNIALNKATCDWVTVLDSDDYIESGRFKKLLSYSDGYELIADDQYRVYEHDKTTEKTEMLGAKQCFPVTISLAEFIESNITKEGQYRKELGFIKPIIKLDFLLKHRLTYQETMRLGEDYELYCRCLALGAKLKLIEASGYVAVVREASLSGSHSKQDLIQLRDCNYEIINRMPLEPQEKKLMIQHADSINIKIQWIDFYSSVKSRNCKMVIKSFFNSYSAFKFILKNLKEQFAIRILKRSSGK
jgi:succinoglycan biosynthesis protein ExoU